MKNFEVSALLNEIADYLEFGNETFKVRAYRKAAVVVAGLSEDIEVAWKEKRLLEIPGIGEGIAKKIDDFLTNKKSKYIEELRKSTPIDVEQLGSIVGVGPKTMKKLYENLNVKTVSDLENAARQGRIQQIKGLGPIFEQNILKSIEFGRKNKQRLPLGFVLSSAEQIMDFLKKSGFIQRASIAGSTRRMQETIGDIDIIATSKNASKVMDVFTQMPNVLSVLSKGATKSSVRIKEGMQADLRVVDDSIFGAALLYFTGSKQHNIVLRRISIEKGLKLSEYGLFEKKTQKLVAGETEKDVYAKLGLEYIEPELREDEGEIELARQNRLPRLVEYGDLKGDLQMHTKWSDGNNTIEEMAIAAKELGHEYICITDHGGNLHITNPLDEKRMLEQKMQIEKANKKLKGIKILFGTEANITSEGKLDVGDKLLKQMDVVVASIHSGFKDEKKVLTSRMISAMENENVDIIGHPTGRLIGRRDPYEIDFDAVFDAAKRTNTVMEIDCGPYRMDLKDIHVRAAIKAGVKIAISTDAHSTDELKHIKLGIGTARRGWATKDDIINTRNLRDMLRLIKN